MCGWAGASLLREREKDKQCGREQNRDDSACHFDLLPAGSARKPRALKSGKISDGSKLVSNSRVDDTRSRGFGHWKVWQGVFFKYFCGDYIGNVIRLILATYIRLEGTT